MKTKSGFALKVYATEPAAKAAVTRLRKAGSFKGEFDYSEMNNYFANIEAQVKKTNLMSGETFWESINTNYRVSTSSETFWSS